MVIDLTQGSGATAEAALRLSCMYIGVDKDPLAEQVVQARLDKVFEDPQPIPLLKAKWASQMKWSMFSRESSPLSVEVEDGDDGIFITNLS